MSNNSIILIELKKNIEKLDKNYQIEILNYLYNISRIKLNENENGIFVNIGLLEKQEILDLQNKIESFNNIENILKRDD